MTITTSNMLAPVRRYAPAAIGNGDLSLLIDWQGAQFQQEHCGMLPNIRRAGYRYDTQHGELVLFGYFTHELSGAGAVTAWTQSLNTDDGVVTTRCVHEDGTVISGTVFCHLEQNVVVIHKKIVTTSAAPFRFRYAFAPKRTRVTFDGTGRIDYEIDGLFQYRGDIRITADVPLTFSADNGEYTASTTARELTIFLCFDQKITADYEVLLNSTRAAWARYWQESYIHIPSEKILRMYRTSQYHLRISSTRWSIPTGLFDTHWRGLYFAFDEYFNFMALASSGHLEAAARIPHFRYELLEKAKFRVAANTQPPLDAACYPWETNEIGEENSPRGFWYDHIFHASHVALAAWEFYRYSGDRQLLQAELFPVIRASCEWLRIFHIVKNDDRPAVIGVCTDLERLGPAKKNPFMTSCSVIATLEATANAAELLQADTAMIPEWRRLAAELRTTLPQENGRYVPYAGCQEHSIGQLAGIYPYGVLNSDDPAQLAAVADYIAEKDTCGNMYRMGRGVCSWYQCWEAVTLARLGNGEDAFRQLEQIADQAGCFGEMFEIYEMGLRPWFTTAEGKFIQAVNEMLLQFDGATPKIAPAIPAGWKDFSFKLQHRYGGKLEVEYVDGQTVRRELQR